MFPSPRPDRLWAPPSLLFSGYEGLFPWRIKRPECEADRSPPSSAEVKNAWGHTSIPLMRLNGVVLTLPLPSGAEVKIAWSYTSTPPYVFKAWCLVKHRDNFNCLPLILNILLDSLTDITHARTHALTERSSDHGLLCSVPCSDIMYLILFMGRVSLKVKLICLYESCCNTNYKVPSSFSER
jgi:hypothetical protein